MAPSRLCLSLLTSVVIGCIIWLTVYFINLHRLVIRVENGTGTGAGKPLPDPREISMNTTEASWSANRTIAIHWVDLYCEGDNTVLSEEVAKKNIEYSNAILMRSGATFKLTLASKRALYRDFCIIEPNDYIKHSNVFNALSSSMKGSGGFIVVSATIKTAGGFAAYRNPAYVDKASVMQPTKLVMHELGHVWNLPHPWEQKVAAVDLPKPCVPQGTSRDLSACPATLRTCQGATEDEKLDNVMDYMSEHCGRAYHFTPSQIATIENEVVKGII